MWTMRDYEWQNVMSRSLPAASTTRQLRCTCAVCQIVCSAYCWRAIAATLRDQVCQLSARTTLRRPRTFGFVVCTPVQPDTLAIAPWLLSAILYVEPDDATVTAALHAAELAQVRQ